MKAIFTITLLAAIVGNACSAELPRLDTITEHMVYAVNNVSHYYDFHADWGFPRQYLNNGDNKYIKSWCCIYHTNLSNANLMFLFNGEDRLPYVKKDLDKISGFLNDGGGVMILSEGASEEQNKLANMFGASFAKGFTNPLSTAILNGTTTVNSKTGGKCHLKLNNPEKWKIVVEDAEKKTVLAYTKVGKGTVLIGSRALLGNNPDDSNDTINRAMWHKVWNIAAQGKSVNPGLPFETEFIEKIENNLKKDGLDITYNDYLAPAAYAMFDISKRCMPKIEAEMGVPLSAGMASKIILLPTGGGGYSSGEIIALAVWWGGFPEKDESMIEFVTHEAVHSWVLPFNEVWNEPIATYVGNLVMMQMGYREEAERRIAQTINRADKYDTTMKAYDIDGTATLSGVKELTSGEKNDIHWGKTYWIFEQLRKENPGVIAGYFKLKRKYAIPGQIQKYDINSTVSLLSMAMGRDLFPWFAEYGINVSKEKAEITMKL